MTDSVPKENSTQDNEADTNDSQSATNPFGLLHANASSATYVFYLKACFTVWLVYFVLNPIQSLSELPLEYAVAIGWLAILPEFLLTAICSFAGLLTIRLLIISACIGVWFGKTRFVSTVIGTILITTVCTLTRGFGHINHAEIGPLLVTWVLMLFLWRMPRNTLQSPSHEPNSTCAAGIVCATIVFTFVYAFVGIARLVSGGMTVLAGDSITNHLLRAQHSDWILSFDASSIVLASPILLLLLKLGTVAVSIVELSSPLSLVNRRIRLLMLSVMPGFHLGAMLLFKVFFIEQLFFMVLLVNVTPWLAKSASRPSALSRVKQGSKKTASFKHRVGHTG